jgi:limonene-1,2-epoxide hydrolase
VNPVVGAAFNDDPTSPTRRGDPSAGLFGWKMAHLTDSSLTTVTDCQRMAAAELAKGTGVASAISLTAVPMPHLEALDVIDVATDGDRVSQTVSRHMVDSYTLDLSAAGAFPVQTRDLGQVIA